MSNLHSQRFSHFFLEDWTADRLTGFAARRLLCCQEGAPDAKHRSLCPDVPSSHQICKIQRKWFPSFSPILVARILSPVVTILNTGPSYSAQVLLTCMYQPRSAMSRFHFPPVPDLWYHSAKENKEIKLSRTTFDSVTPENTTEQCSHNSTHVLGNDIVIDFNVFVGNFVVRWKTGFTQCLQSNERFPSEKRTAHAEIITQKKFARCNFEVFTSQQMFAANSESLHKQKQERFHNLVRTNLYDFHVFDNTLSDNLQMLDEPHLVCCSVHHLTPFNSGNKVSRVSQMKKCADNNQTDQMKKARKHNGFQCFSNQWKI